MTRTAEELTEGLERVRQRRQAALRRSRDLGIPPNDLYYALKLIREIRARYLSTDGDPRALRIALIYANLVDRNEAAKKLDKNRMNALSEIAVELFEVTRGTLGL